MKDLKNLEEFKTLKKSVLVNKLMQKSIKGGDGSRTYFRSGGDILTDARGEDDIELE